MEKYLYLTSQEYAVLLHLTGSRCVTGFSLDFPEDTHMKRRLLFDLYRKGVICNRDDRFETVPEWKDVLRNIQNADRVIWISFSDKDKQDILLYVCGKKAVCIENLSDRDHDRYRLSMENTADLKAKMTESGMFPRIRMNRKDSEMLDERLGVTEGRKIERICTFALFGNGESLPREKTILEREQLIYYVRIENAEGIARRRACSDESELILDRYMNSEV